MICTVVMDNRNHSSPTNQSPTNFKQFDLNNMRYSKSYHRVYNDVFDEIRRMNDYIESNCLIDNQEPTMGSFQHADSVQRKRLPDHANDDATNKQKIQNIHI